MHDRKIKDFEKSKKLMDYKFIIICQLKVITAKIQQKIEKICFNLNLKKIKIKNNYMKNVSGQKLNFMNNNCFLVYGNEWDQLYKLLPATEDFKLSVQGLKFNNLYLNNELSERMLFCQQENFLEKMVTFYVDKNYQNILQKL